MIGAEPYRSCLDDLNWRDTTGHDADVSQQATDEVEQNNLGS